VKPRLQEAMEPGSGFTTPVVLLYAFGDAVSDRYGILGAGKDFNLSGEFV